MPEYLDDVELDYHNPTEPGLYVYLNYDNDPLYGQVQRIGPFKDGRSFIDGTISFGEPDKKKTEYIVPIASIRYIMNVMEEKNED